MKENNTGADILAEMFGKAVRYVNWKLEMSKEGKMTKVPYYSKTKKASVTDPKTWKTYEQATMALDNGANNFSGIGIILFDSKLVCIDIDHVLVDGKIISPFADVILSLLNTADTFTEISQSGTGLHLFFKLTEPFKPLTNKKAPFEVYSNVRFIALTNNSYHKTPLSVRTVSVTEMEAILKIIGYPFGKDKISSADLKNTIPVSEDSELLSKMFASKKGSFLKNLYSGDISQQKNDPSSADFAFCSNLAFWTRKNPTQMKRIWLSSPLGQRAKTQKRADYQDRTIANAIEQCKNVLKESKKEGRNGDIEEDEEETKKYKTSVITDQHIYEMVHDKVKNLSSFVRADRNGVIEAGIMEVTVGNQKYLPLSGTHDFITKNVVLFPSCPMEFGSEKELLNKIQTFIHKYLDISETYERVASYYVLFTWLYDQFYEVPYLRALGDFGSGKTRFLQTIGFLCYKPIFTGGATTTSPLFRIMDEMNGTLVLDEADFNKSDMSSEIIKILNMGYQKNSGVMRSEGKGTYEVKVYNVFGPKIIATRETFGDKALESRCLVEEMGKSTLRAGIPLTTHKNFPEEALELRNQLLMWRLKNYFKSFEVKEEVIPGIHPRLNQIVLPLFCIIKDEGVKEELVEFIKKYNDNLTDDRSLSREAEIIFHILKLQHDGFNTSELSMKEIAGSMNEDKDSIEEEISPRKIGWYLRAKLQLKPQKSRRGFILNLNTSAEKLLFWKERFGVTDEDIQGEHSNVVNVIKNSGREVF